MYTLYVLKRYTANARKGAEQCVKRENKAIKKKANVRCKYLVKNIMHKNDAFPDYKQAVGRKCASRKVVYKACYKNYTI